MQEQSKMSALWWNLANKYVMNIYQDNFVNNVTLVPGIKSYSIRSC